MDVTYIPECSISTSEIQDSRMDATTDNNTSNSIINISFNNATSACNDEDMYVDISKGRTGASKNYFCFYCKKKVTKLARHFEVKHPKEDDVKRILSLTKGSLERRQQIGKLRKKGNYLFNTDPSYNDGELLVARRPQRKLTKTAKDFKACGNCKAYYSKNSLRKHYKICKGVTTKSRLALYASKIAMRRVNAVASDVVRNELFPTLREDDVTRAIRYDELVVYWANKMCEKYKNKRHQEMIRAKIRLLGRYVLEMRKLSTEISNLKSTYDPKYCDATLKAISIVAKYNEATMSYSNPTVAFHLGSLIKLVGRYLINICIRNHEDEKRKYTEDFLKLMEIDISVSVNRTAAESQLQRQRRSKVILPSKEDITKLNNHVIKLRKRAVSSLLSSFSIESWLELAETTLVAIQLFNRRRAGEVERILIEDFNSYQSLCEEDNNELFNSLSDNAKKYAKEYVRFLIRGKLNRTVPVLLDSGMLQAIKILLKYRDRAKVPTKNPYIFGLPSMDKKSQDKYLRACALLRKYSVQSGAKNPERLRGTQLRKHVATTCISLNLTEAEVSDLANFMGHGEAIHKNIYRQPILEKDIVNMSKLLETAQGTGDHVSTSGEESNAEPENNLNQESIFFPHKKKDQVCDVF